MVLQDGRVRVRSIDPRHYWREAGILMDLYNACWERNWGFVPLTEAEFMYAAAQMRPLVTRYPEGALVAEVNGEPAGFCLAIADANQALIRLRSGRLLPLGFLRLGLGLRRLTQARLLALGVRPEFRRSGLDAVFAMHLMKLGGRLGFRRAELGWTLEDNRAVRRTIQRAAMIAPIRCSKTYRLYDLALR
jgi:GNAT superfamily N-acetyltransferase